MGIQNIGKPVPFREFNSGNDVTAANEVLQSGAQIWLIPSDVYTTINVTLAELKVKVEPYGKIGHHLYHNMIDYNLSDRAGWTQEETELLWKEIRAAANAGARAYENEDQAALSNAWNALQETEEFLKEDHGTQERPPMWLACTFFAQQCLELIGKYQSSDKVPPAARRDIDPWVPKIQQSCREIMQACRFMPSDEECMPHLQVIRELYPIAEKAAKAVGVTPPKGP